MTVSYTHLDVYKRQVFYFEDTQKRRAAAGLIHPALLEELREMLGPENVVLKDEVQR